MRGKRIATIVGVVALTASAGPRCGGDKEPEVTVTGGVEDGSSAPAPASAAAPKPAHPETEEALVEAFVAALEARDLEALRALTAPELGADLHRMHGQDAAAFWGRGHKLVANVRSGVEVAAKQEGREDRWRALLRFDSGEEETVVFTRVDGKLVFHEL